MTRSDDMPYAELDGLGRYMRRVRAGGPSVESRVCEGCGNVMPEKAPTCSARCEAMVDDRYSHDYGTDELYDPNVKPTTAARALLYLLAGVAMLVATYMLATWLS